VRAFAKWIIEHPKKTLIIVLIITMIFIASASRLEEETSLNALFPQYPEVKILEKIQQDFGNVEPVIIIIRDENVLSPKYFNDVAKITAKILQNRTITALITPKERSITSLPGLLAQYKLSKKGILNYSQEDIIKEMLSFKTTKDIMDTFREFLKNPVIPNMLKDYTLSLLPKDFNETEMKSKGMVIYVLLNASFSDSELERIEVKIEKIAKEVNPSSLVYGFHLMNYYYAKTEEQFIPAFFVALILILILMFLNFKSIRDVALSLITLFIAMIWTFGFAGALGWKLDLIAGAVPILILGLGIDFSFHVLMSYREKLKELKPRNAMKEVISTVGIALLLAMVTTVVGFSSNTISNLPSIKKFGLLSAFSIFSVFLLNLTFVPAIKVVWGSARSGKYRTRSKSSRQIFTLKPLNRKSVATLILLIAVVASMTGWVLGFRMKASYNLAGELAKGLSVTKAYQVLNKEFDIGTERVYIRIDGNLTNPRLWREVQEAIRKINDDQYVVKSNGIAKVEWLLSALPIIGMENPAIFNMISLIDRDKDGLIDESVSPKVLSEFLNNVYSTTIGRYYIHKDNGEFRSLLIVVPTKTNFGYHGKELLRELKEDFEGINANISITGNPIIWAKGLDDIRDSMINSIILCLVFAVLVLPLAFVVAHCTIIPGFLAAMVPGIVLGWLFLTMRILGIPLNVMTAMVGAIIVGIGIDYPIHIANRWTLEKKSSKDFLNCYTVSLNTTGKEVLYSALTTLIAFGVLVMIPIPVIAQFATTILFGIVYSLLGAVVLLPALIKLTWS